VLPWSGTKFPRKKSRWFYRLTCRFAGTVTSLKHFGAVIQNGLWTVLGNTGITSEQLNESGLERVFSKEV
jgi:hypothetical protein